MLACLTTNEKNFPEKYAERFCSFIEECDGSTLKDEFNDLDDCVDDVVDDLDDLDLEDCDFDVDKARDCLDRMDQGIEDCDEDDLYDEDCAEVYDCDGSSGGGGGGGGLGFSSDAFIEAYIDKACATGCDDSFFYCNFDNYTQGTTTADCDFDADKARDCLNDEWTCESGGTSSSFTSAPAACSEVYDCAT